VFAFRRKLVVSRMTTTAATRAARFAAVRFRGAAARGGTHCHPFAGRDYAEQMRSSFR